MLSRDKSWRVNLQPCIRACTYKWRKPMCPTLHRACTFRGPSTHLWANAERMRKLTFSYALFWKCSLVLRALRSNLPNLMGRSLRIGTIEKLLKTILFIYFYPHSVDSKKLLGPRTGLRPQCWLSVSGELQFLPRFYEVSGKWSAWKRSGKTQSWFTPNSTLFFEWIRLTLNEVIHLNNSFLTLNGMRDELYFFPPSLNSLKLKCLKPKF